MVIMEVAKRFTSSWLVVTGLTAYSRLTGVCAAFNERKFSTSHSCQALTKRQTGKREIKI